MSKKELPAETKAEQRKEDETQVTSSPNNGNTFVVGSQSPASPEDRLKEKESVKDESIKAPEVFRTAYKQVGNNKTIQTFQTVPDVLNELILVKRINSV